MTKRSCSMEENRSQGRRRGNRTINLVSTKEQQSNKATFVKLQMKSFNTLRDCCVFPAHSNPSEFPTWIQQFASGPHLHLRILDLKLLLLICPVYYWLCFNVLGISICHTSHGSHCIHQISFTALQWCCQVIGVDLHC